MSNEERWLVKAKNLLVGRTIADVTLLTEEEADQLGWEQTTFAITLDDGTTLFSSRDDEGNGPGAIFTNTEELPILPVMPLRRSNAQGR